MLDIINLNLKEEFHFEKLSKIQKDVNIRNWKKLHRKFNFLLCKIFRKFGKEKKKRAETNKT